MNNNQNNTNKTIYQYNVTASSNINYGIKNIQKPNINVKLVKQSMGKNTHGPALVRAMKALKLINPFKGA